MSVNSRTLALLSLLLPCLALSSLAGAQEVPAEVDDPNAPNWVDTSHEVVANRAQALTLWLDGFFGDPDYDLERAQSFLRLELINDWDEQDGGDQKARVRGKVQLPKISKRLELVFSESDGDQLTEEELEESEDFGLQYRISRTLRSRFDATLAWAGGDLRPGVRFRHEAPLSDQTTYRYIQRLEYEKDENFFTTANVDLNHLLDEHNILRWSNRIVYGEKTDGVEWRTRLSLRQVWDQQAKRPIAMAYYGSINGETDPSFLVNNYRLGVVWRRQVYRDFLFLNLEPAWNYRRRNEDESRESAWSFLVRVEIALHKDLRRARNRD
ncbi:hypothetical protein E4634_12450 [Mangrovimicrobium sediminis]|uniref:DUF2490 domain-containing protein n=1 Tax=Mangrovimicrobium sediminis TaxID=2562682 RepID=A0A4Z0M0Y7_9GAMM|nr:hypothetical protein [Haliea sp. SAOS-164]TGD73084.1 hypothetical protein E4634_12450 [Haliea sp. SAOS-164]